MKPNSAHEPNCSGRHMVDGTFDCIPQPAYSFPVVEVPGMPDGTMLLVSDTWLAEELFNFRPQQLRQEPTTELEWIRRVIRRGADLRMNELRREAGLATRDVEPQWPLPQPPIRFAMEERIAMSVVRPESFIIGSL